MFIADKTTSPYKKQQTKLANQNDMNDEKELFDYMELSFQSLLGDKTTNIKNMLYKVGLNISANDTAKANINMDKRRRDHNNEIVFLNDMFIDNIASCGLSIKSRGKDDIGYYNIIIRNHLKNIHNEKKMRVMLYQNAKIINV